MSLVVDVHTHMLTRGWMDTLKSHGAPRYDVRAVGALPEVVHMDGAPSMTVLPEMFDFERRITNMNRARVDVAVVSLTCPSVFWGGEAVSTRTAVGINDEFAAAQTAYPDRIRWFASLPWQYPEAAIAELKRTVARGAAGVVTLGNIDGLSLTDPLFAPIWEAIDELALPVFVHPSAPPGSGQLDMARHNLVPPLGFIFDTSLSIARCIYDGFFDRYPRLKLIAGHGGGALPFLVGRMDMCYERIPTCSSRIHERPANYMRRIYVDSVVFRQDALQMCVDVCGTDNVLYGSDYPHNIGDMIGCLSRVDALESSVRHQVRGGNARRLFNL